MDKEKVLNLAKLARIEMGETEAEKLSQEFAGILRYVSEVKSVTSDQEVTDDKVLKNIMREDGEPHESGLYTDKILAQAPKREGDYMKVKKIL